MNYEVIVVGGGHAGCEAALASSRKGHKTLLVTGSISNIATMPCNPSIGGSAKGIIVREIDALGGAMGEVADATLIQMKMLNYAKGPAVKSLRAQADKITYPREMLKVLRNEKDLSIKEGMVEDLIVKDNTVYGVVLDTGENITSNIVILTTGTYLKSDILIGDTRTRSGPHNEKPSMHLSDNLKKYGFNILRLKTGTPPRIERSSIDFTKTQREDGDKQQYTFSHTKEPVYDVNNQEPCYLIYTTDKTKKIILDNLNKSSMYGGLDDITGVGPRYCPSIEDKIVRFSDKEKHQLFLEPESKYYDDIYIQGFSTSMPRTIQEEMVHSLPGLEHAKILRYAYAIEYDAIYPTQIKPSLETKILNNLFTAGQINGTSGYEEAACQGLIAGINAALKLEKKEPLILKRNEAYIGVLIDDLVTKGTKEPYRMLTSRAEYRLLLRHDNSDLRLTEYGHKVGLVKGIKYEKFIEKKNNILELTEKLKEIKITVDNEKNRVTTTIYDYLKNPSAKLEEIIKNFKLDLNYSKEVIEEVEIQIKYEGYIKKVEREAEKMLKNEEKQIPVNIDYDKVPNLASEARQKLKEVRPLNIGQAIRISGVNPSDISILLVYLRKFYNV
ncbi:MAG: tRNA uridine-5-carboxymethylaminomethyl(34) synthesis enzyme MnmG [Bacilli bacterium]